MNGLYITQRTITPVKQKTKTKSSDFTADSKLSAFDTDNWQRSSTENTIIVMNTRWLRGGGDFSLAIDSKYNKSTLLAHRELQQENFILQGL